MEYVELKFPAFYMYLGKGTGNGDILYCENKDDCSLIYSVDGGREISIGTKLNVFDWSAMQRLSDETVQLFGLKKPKLNIKDVYDELVMNSFKKNGTLGKHNDAVDAMKYTVHSIQQERESDYGDAQESFESIADFWENYLNRKTGFDFTVDAIDVALMMSLMKISRNAHRRKEDNFVDGESYANFATRFFEKE